MNEFGKLRRLSSRIFMVASLGSLLFFGCAKKEGGEGEDCYSNGTCDGSLVCLSRVCVDPAAEGTTSHSSGDTGGVDLEECFSCGDGACASQRTACDDAQGCDGLLECMLGCGSDVGCRAGCSVAGLTAQQAADAGLAAGNYVTCAFTSCADDCVPSVGTTSDSSEDTGDFDADTCATCGETACSKEYTDCENTTSCTSVFECTWGCLGATDASCASSCLDDEIGRAHV